jgi:hypothetical protein
MLSLGPSPRLLHGPPDVGSSLGSAGIAGEVVVFRARSIRSRLMPLVYAATRNAISAAAGRSWYLIEVRKRSRDMLDNLRPLWGERELSRRLASRSCSRASYNFVISCSKPSAIGYCCPPWLCRRANGKRPSGFLYFGLQLVKPGSRPNLLQSAALGSASYRSANVCAAKVPRSLGNTLECLSQA